MASNITLPDRLLSRVSPVEDLFVIMRAVRNWHDILLFRSGLKKRITVHFRTGGSIEIKNRTDYFRFVHRTKDWALELARQTNGKIGIGKNIVKINAFGKRLLFYFDSPTALGSTVGLGLEQFVEEEYSWLDAAGKDVVDIGATIGDTAIYFAARNARHVYAIEPYPNACRIARRNIKLNNMGSKITMLNQAVGGKRGFARMKKHGEIGSGVYLEQGISSGGKRIEIVTLEDIVKRYGIRKGVLKIDCEGGEYDIILGASRDTLRSFDQIEMEYHHGYINLEKKLESCGFDVRHTTPKYSGYDNVIDPIMYVGLLSAKKR